MIKSILQKSSHQNVDTNFEAFSNLRKQMWESSAEGTHEPNKVNLSPNES